MVHQTILATSRIVSKAISEQKVNHYSALGARAVYFFLGIRNK